MKIPVALLILLCLAPGAVLAQEEKDNDSAAMLEPVVITAFGQHGSNTKSSVMVKIIQNNNADRYNKISLVDGFNSIAGVRMEERSPGSYRIAMRGSSLRSPFGVRNVKVYWNDIPFTDPGGNTYFNAFSFNNFSYIEVLKGPAGSMYGAGTGGLLLVHSFNRSWKPSVGAEYIGGSYGLQNILADMAFGGSQNRHQLSFNHIESDGYRNHTRLVKNNASYSSQLTITEKETLTTSLLYTDLYYQTPGALTKAEWTANPRQARPRSGSFPSADAAKAAIFQQNFLAGISHEYRITPDISNTSSVYGSFAKIRNPTFRNYERRVEPSFGGRTSFNYNKKLGEAALQLTAGGEWQEAFFNTQVFTNNNGSPDTLRTDDDIRYSTHTVFAQADLNIKDNWILTAGASSSRLSVNFTRLNQYPVRQQGRRYDNEWSPRVAIRKNIGSSALFASVSKGFSPPTIGELLPSTGVISTQLEAEDGVNYELGGHTALFQGKLQLDLTGFYFRLNNALVTRKDSSNADYFVNAGNTRQRGIEFSANYLKSFLGGFLDYITIRQVYTYYNFVYGDFQKGNTSYSGKHLPGAPEHALSLQADLQSKKGPYLNLNWYFASTQFVDDGNTASAAAYHLLGGRLGWKLNLQKAYMLNGYVGADNLLNQDYSLGNDINAAGGRYYNAAPGRNFYAGIALRMNTGGKKHLQAGL